MTSVSAKITNALIGKAVAETLLVGGLALFFFFQAFPPYFRGWSEIDQHALVGWASNTAYPSSRVEVQLFIDGEFVGRRTANEFRPDVHAAGWAADDWHGYRFELQPLPTGPHQARVYAVHSSRGGKRQSLMLLGNPVDFVVHGDGSLSEVKTKR